MAIAGSDEVKPLSVKLRMSELKRLVEIDIKEDEVAALLQPLGFTANIIGEGTVDVSVPTFRMKDVNQEVDLVEEVCRLFGYDRVPISMPAQTMAPERQELDNLIRIIQEACLRSRVKRSIYFQFGWL